MSSMLSLTPPRGLPKVNMLFVGGVIAGKSSLMSSVDSIFKWRISRTAGHCQATGSFTQALTQYTLQSSSRTWTSLGEEGPQLHSHRQYAIFL